MMIFIPTRGRVDRQITRAEMFLEEITKLYYVTYIIPECEVKEWLLKNGQPGSRFRPVPDEYRFSDIRQFIVDEFADEDQYHVVVDDDLRLDRRVIADDPEASTLVATEQDTWDLFRRIEKYLLQDGYIHGAVSAREGNNRQIEPVRENGRAMRFHFYDAKILQGEEFDFRDIETKQDFHMTLTLLELGYPNIIDYEFMHGQPGSDKSGGCSRYRDEAMMIRSAHKLKELHPDFVKIVEKTTKGSWGGGTRTDVRIQWQKAFCSREQGRKLYRKEKADG